MSNGSRNTSSVSREDEFTDKYIPDQREDPNRTMHRIETAQSVVLSPEMFEKLYLSPQNEVKGELRKTFGNPTPV